MPFTTCVKCWKLCSTCTRKILFTSTSRWDHDKVAEEFTDRIISGSVAFFLYTTAATKETLVMDPVNKEACFCLNLSQSEE